MGGHIRSRQIHRAPTIPLGIYSGVPPTTCVFIPLTYIEKTYRTIVYDWFSLVMMGQSFLRGKGSDLEAMRRLRRRESIHSIVQVCTKPKAADDAQ
jgi:hypothetical protein